MRTMGAWIVVLGMTLWFICGAIEALTKRRVAPFTYAGRDGPWTVIFAVGFWLLGLWVIGQVLWKVLHALW